MGSFSHYWMNIYEHLQSLLHPLGDLVASAIALHHHQPQEWWIVDLRTLRQLGPVAYSTLTWREAATGFQLLGNNQTKIGLIEVCNMNWLFSVHQTSWLHFCSLKPMKKSMISQEPLREPTPCFLQTPLFFHRAAEDSEHRLVTNNMPGVTSLALTLAALPPLGASHCPRASQCVGIIKAESNNFVVC